MTKYKIVPLEPTDEMQHAGAVAVRFDTTVLNKIWTANAAFRAMLAAAPDVERFTVDDLAQEIRRVDGKHDLGAGQLAEKLFDFIDGKIPEPDYFKGYWVPLSADGKSVWIDGFGLVELNFPKQGQS